MVNFTIDLPTINLYNEEKGVGFRLDIDERPEEGIFNFKFSFPSQWYPKLLEYNRSGSVLNKILLNFPKYPPNPSLPPTYIWFSGMIDVTSDAGYGLMLLERRLNTSMAVGSSTLTWT